MKKMRRLIVLMAFVCGLVIAPTSAFTQDYKWADAFMTPYTGNLLNGFGGFVLLSPLIVLPL